MTFANAICSDLILRNQEGSSQLKDEICHQDIRDKIGPHKFCVLILGGQVLWDKRWRQMCFTTSRTP